MKKIVLLVLLLILIFTLGCTNSSNNSNLSDSPNLIEEIDSDLEISKENISKLKNFVSSSKSETIKNKDIFTDDEFNNLLNSISNLSSNISLMENLILQSNQSWIETKDYLNDLNELERNTILNEFNNASSEFLSETSSLIDEIDKMDFFGEYDYVCNGTTKIQILFDLNSDYYYSLSKKVVDVDSVDCGAQDKSKIFVGDTINFGDFTLTFESVEYPLNPTINTYSDDEVIRVNLTINNISDDEIKFQQAINNFISDDGWHEFSSTVKTDATIVTDSHLGDAALIGKNKSVDLTISLESKLDRADLKDSKEFEGNIVLITIVKGESEKRTELKIYFNQDDIFDAVEQNMLDKKDKTKIEYWEENTAVCKHCAYSLSYCTYDADCLYELASNKNECELIDVAVNAEHYTPKFENFEEKCIDQLG